MDDRTARPTTLSPTDATLDATVPEGDNIESSAGSSAEPGYWGRAALVQGSGPELTRETQSLLRGRLRLAAVILFLGFAAFMVKHVFQADFATPHGTAVFILHAVTTLVVGLTAAVLCLRCTIALPWLRGLELIVFGLSGVLFLTVQYCVTFDSCCQEGYFDFPAGAWLVLIYTYALFIPNTLRRAAVVIGLMAAAPIALLSVMVWVHPQVAQFVTVDRLTGIVLLLLVSAGGSVFGVDTIGSLRREAFEARQLGQYRLTRRIGAGGMGEVYLAEHQLLKRPCVVKLILPERAGDRNVLARFQREVRATAKLTHWNTVEIFDYGSTEDGTFYYVMEYLPGMSLAELVRLHGPMPPERMIHFLRQACDALGEAHAAGMIHRDIKPANIFAAQRGGVYDVTKLLDFGLVKPVIEEQPIHLTAEGSITGSPLFMSPEQATGDGRPDARSDIYSLGAVGYFLLTGRPPFEGKRPIKVLIAHAHHAVVAPSQLRQDVPGDLEKVILRCLAKTPAERFSAAAELSEALGRCADAEKWTRQRADEWWQRHGQQVDG